MLLQRLLENLSLSVEAFASCHVARSWRLRLPALDWATLHYVSEGEGSVRDGAGELLKLPVGSLAVVPPHLLHSLECGAPPYGEATAGSPRARKNGLPAHLAGPEEEEGLVVVCGKVEVRYRGGPGLFDQLNEVLVLDFSEDESMRGTFESMAEEILSGRPGAVVMTTALMRQCLVRVFRELGLQDTCQVLWLRALDDPSMAPVLEAMLTHPELRHTVASLAERAYMSRSAFARRFRESFGQPPLEYLRGIRLRRAADLLKEFPSMSIAAVARRSGFSSRSQFSRAFRAHFGAPPTQFRA